MQKLLLILWICFFSLSMTGCQQRTEEDNTAKMQEAVEKMKTRIIEGLSGKDKANEVEKSPQEPKEP